MKKVYYMATGNYRAERRNETAHAMKRCEHWAIGKAAAAMADYIPSNAVIIPMPSHTGRATYTLELAQRIARATNAKVIDALRCQPRETLYNLKKQGRKPSPYGLHFYKVQEIPKGKRVIIIDNVVATGTTATAAVRTLGEGVVLAYAAATDSKQIEGLTRVNPFIN